MYLSCPLTRRRRAESRLQDLRRPANRPLLWQGHRRLARLSSATWSRMSSMSPARTATQAVSIVQAASDATWDRVSCGLSIALRKTRMISAMAYTISRGIEAAPWVSDGISPFSSRLSRTSEANKSATGASRSATTLPRQSTHSEMDVEATPESCASPACQRRCLTSSPLRDGPTTAMFPARPEYVRCVLLLGDAHEVRGSRPSLTGTPHHPAQP